MDNAHVGDTILSVARTRWPELPEGTWVRPVDITTEDKRKANRDEVGLYLDNWARKIDVPMEKVQGIWMGIALDKRTGRLFLLVEEAWVDSLTRTPTRLKITDSLR